MSAPRAVPSTPKSDSFSLVDLTTEFAESINFGKALANYLIERNRTKNMRKVVEAAKDALDARNREERDRTEIIVENYRQQMSAFLDQQQEKLRLETQRMEMESKALVERAASERERHSLKVRQLTALMKMYLDHIEQMQRHMSDIESDAERFVKKNRLYFQLEEDCRAKFAYINKRLNQLQNESEE